MEKAFVHKEQSFKLFIKVNLFGKFATNPATRNTSLGAYVATQNEVSDILEKSGKAHYFLARI